MFNNVFNQIKHRFHYVFIFSFPMCSDDTSPRPPAPNASVLRDPLRRLHHQEVGGDPMRGKTRPKRLLCLQ